MSAYRTEATIKLRYEHDLEELLDGGPPLPWRRRYRLACGAILALVTVALVARHGLPGLVAAAVVGALTIGLLVRSTGRRALAAHYRRVWDHFRESFVEATDESLVFGNRITRSELAWELVLAWRETETYYHLFTSPRAYHAIPKRAFATPEQATAFRQLLASRVGRGGDAALEGRRGWLWLPFAVYLGTVALLLGALMEGALALFG